MKKNLLLVFTCLAIYTVQAQQKFYNLTVSSSTYSNLVNPIAITTPDGSGTGYYFNYNLKYPFFNLLGSFRMNSSIPSLGAFVANDGYVAVYDEPSYVYTAVWQVLVPAGLSLEKKSTSALSYVYEGTPGSGILKVEWKNYGLKDMHDSEFVNMQLWLDEGTNTFSYHYGPRVISQPMLMFSGMFLTPNAQFGTFTRSISLKGAPLSPILDSASGFTSMPVVNDIPPSGTVYTFSKNTTGIRNVAAYDGSVYPNPSNGNITLQLPEPLENYQLEMFDITGKRVYNSEGHETGTSLNISASVPAGVYQLRVVTNNAVVTESVVIQ